MIDLRKILIQTGFGAMALLVVSGLLLLACGFIFYGATLGLSEALGGRMWLSYLVVGLTLLFALLLTLKLKLGKDKKQPALPKPQGEAWLQKIFASMDLEGVTQRHPWETTGAAVAVGFVAGYSFSDSTLLKAGSEVFKTTLTPLLVEQVQEWLRQSA